MPWPTLAGSTVAVNPVMTPSLRSRSSRGVGGGAADADLGGQAVHRQPAVGDEGGDDAPVDVVELVGHGDGLPDGANGMSGT